MRQLNRRSDRQCQFNILAQADPDFCVLGLTVTQTFSIAPWGYVEKSEVYANKDAGLTTEMFSRVPDGSSGVRAVSFGYVGCKKGEDDV